MAPGYGESGDINSRPSAGLTWEFVISRFWIWIFRSSFWGSNFKDCSLCSGCSMTWATQSGWTTLPWAFWTNPQRFLEHGETYKHGETILYTVIVIYIYTYSIYLWNQTFALKLWFPWLLIPSCLKPRRDRFCYAWRKRSQACGITFGSKDTWTIPEVWRKFGGPEKKGNIVRSRFMRETFVAICLEACFFAADVHREKVIDPATNALSLQGSI